MRFPLGLSRKQFPEYSFRGLLCGTHDTRGFAGALEEMEGSDGGHDDNNGDGEGIDEGDGKGGDSNAKDGGDDGNASDDGGGDVDEAFQLYLQAPAVAAGFCTQGTRLPLTFSSALSFRVSNTFRYSLSAIMERSVARTRDLLLDEDEDDTEGEEEESSESSASESEESDSEPKVRITRSGRKEVPSRPRP